LVEIVTDKVAMELPSPAAGTITKILVGPGDTVSMGVAIAEMDADEAPNEDSSSDPSDDLDSDPVQPDRIGTLVQGVNVVSMGSVVKDTSAPEPERTEPDDPPAQARGTRTRISPVVARLAAENGIDLASVSGTGFGGRITRNDILKAVRGRALRPASHGKEGGDSGDRLIVQSPAKKLTASHMLRSWREVPHAWTAVEIDVTGMVSCRNANRETVNARFRVDLTYLPFTIRAAARALAANRLLNSTWEGNAAYTRNRINIGIAVAGKDGLYVPVLHDAEQETLTGIAKRTSELVAKARNGALELGDVQGGTFTLNNTGALGSILGGAIINLPQVAILTTEAIVKRPMVVDSDRGEKVAVRSIMNACLSFDHRVIDGAEAAPFLREFKAQLESVSADTPVE
jgi:2-oxoisovalerate dehydrogenase E2 component (dihydrolipoyl transacylase)